MALAGTLRDFSLADIFQLISFQRKTGVLTLRNKEQTVTVSVINGAIVSADSLPKRLDDHLGQVLVKQALITSDQLEKALQIQSETMQKMGYILTHSNFITTEALKEALQTQISQIIYRLFRWTDGHYEFAQTDSVEYDREYITPIQIENVLMEGMRMLDEWPIISKKIPNFDLVFRREIKPEEYEVEGAEDAFTWDEAAGAEPATRIKLSPNEHMVFQLIDGSSSVQAIVERCRLTEFETCRALYDLLSRNLISDGSGGRRPAVRAAGVGGIVEVAPEAWDYRPFALALVLLLSVLSLLLGLIRPVNVLFRFEPRMMDFSEAEKTAAFVEMERIAEKVRVYFLHTHRYPASLEVLKEAGLVGPREISDRQGPKYRLETRDGSIRLVALRSPEPLRIVIDSVSSPAAVPDDEP